MNIKITGRHLDVSDNLKNHSEEKLSKMEKYFHQLIDTHLILYKEKLDHVAEVIINGDAVQFHAKEKSGNFYSAIDMLVDKLESQVARYKDKIQSKKGGVAEVEIPLELDSEKRVSVQLRQVANKPIDNIEAYLQMKVNGDKFILFKKGHSDIDSNVDYLNKNYAVIFKSKDDVKMFEVPFEKHDGDCHEYAVQIHDESVSSPKIDFNKLETCSIGRYNLNEAIEGIVAQGKEFLPFYNTETGYLNVIIKQGNGYEVMVPAF